MLHGDLIGERARLTPEKSALVLAPSGLRFTYRELNERAERCARFWQESLGLSRGDRVGLLAHNRVEFLDAFFAAAKTGIILVPLGTRLTPHELEYILADCQMKALLYGGSFLPVVRELVATAPLSHWVALDSMDRVATHSYSSSIETLPADPSWKRSSCDPEEVLCLLYTSGTTGRPKGVMVPHRMVTWNAYNTALNWQLREDDTSPIFTPLYHAGGLGAFLAPILAIGGSLVLHEAFDAREVLETIDRERCTVVLGVPTIYKLLMEAPEFATTGFSTIRWLISGGAPLPLYIIDAYQKRGITFKQGYGLTEVGVNCFSMTSQESARKAGSIGKPMMFTRARLVDGEGRDVAPGEVGELWLAGPHVCKGYWGNPEATAAALDADGYFHTGDLARQDEDGFFYIAGRKKEMLISGGVNVYPAEIEAELLQHPAVKDAAVAGIPHDTWGEVGIAFVVLREAASAADLVAFLEGRLARYKIPRDFVFLAELPRTAYGKVVKGTLRDEYLARKREGREP